MSPSWQSQLRIQKYDADGWLVGRLDKPGGVVCYSGLSALWQLATDGSVFRPFSQSYAALRVGDGSVPATVTDRWLSGRNQAHALMCKDYPDHTDTHDGYGSEVTFRAEFTGEVANFGWGEWGIFNATSGGRMLARGTGAFGVKHPGDTWTLCVTLVLPDISEETLASEQVTAV